MYKEKFPLFLRYVRTVYLHIIFTGTSLCSFLILARKSTQPSVDIYHEITFHRPLRVLDIW